MREELNQDRFLFCSRCGHPRPVARSHMEFQCQACGYKHFINPIAGVAALLCDPQNRILLLRRAKEPGKGKLGLPGGFVDLGESAEAALMREIREEVGLEVPQLDYLVSLPNRYFYQGITIPVLDLFYTARLPSLAEARPLSEVLALEIRPVPEVDPQEMAFVSNAQAIQTLAQRLGPTV